MSRASIRRFLDQPAFVLHRYDWSETSLIIEVFSRQHGRLALVAKGAKRPTSQLRPVLLPLQPLLLSWSGEGEVRTLKTAQWRGGHVMPMGEALLAGTYFNEMLMRLLVRDEPHPALFDTYAQAVERLAQRGEPDPCVLRAFELLLLKESGYLPMLSEEGNTLAPLEPGTAYLLEPEGGLRRAQPSDKWALAAAHWQALQAALADPDALDALITASRPCVSALQAQLRPLLHYHGGVRVFKTRQMMLDVQALVRPR